MCVIAGIRTTDLQHTEYETNLSLIHVSIQDSRECNMLLFAWERPTSGYFSLDLLIYASHLVLNDINIEILYIR